MDTSRFGRHEESTTVVAASPTVVFAFLDDHAHLSGHMSERSWMMGGGRMEISTDAGRGRQAGSRLRLAGRVFGLQLTMDAIVTDHDPPHQKSWETVGEPRLLVVGAYRMGFELAADGLGSRLRVFIDYELPRRGAARWLGRLFGHWYARWCTSQMTRDAARAFAANRDSAPGPRTTEQMRGPAR